MRGIIIFVVAFYIVVGIGVSHFVVKLLGPTIVAQQTYGQQLGDF